MGEALQYAVGNVLYVQGDPSERAYLVRHGTVETHREGPGARAAFKRYGPGEVVGLAETLLGIPRFATARVIVDITVHALRMDEFNALLVSNPAIGLKVVAALSNELRTIDGEIERVLGAPPSAAPDYRILAEAAKARGMYAAAAALEDRIAGRAEAGGRLEAELRAAELEAASGRIDAALARLGTLMAEHPEDDRPYDLYERIRKGPADA